MPREPRQRNAKEIVGELQRIDRAQLDFLAVAPLIERKADFSPIIGDDGSGVCYQRHAVTKAVEGAVPAANPRPNLRAWRAYRGLTQTAVQGRLGWAPSRLFTLESGRAVITDQVLIALADIYDCTVDDLLNRKPDGPSNETETDWDDHKFVALVKKLAKERNLSLAELFRRAKISKDWIRQTPRHGRNSGHILKIAKALGVPAQIFNPSADNRKISGRPSQRDRPVQRVQATEAPRRQGAAGSLTMTFEPGGKIRVRGHIDAVIDKRRFQELIDLIKPEGESEPKTE